MILLASLWFLTLLLFLMSLIFKNFERGVGNLIFIFVDAGFLLFLSWSLLVAGLMLIGGLY